MSGGEHVRVQMDGMDWECVFGDCDHDGDCPTFPVDACAGCTTPGEFEGVEFDTLITWEAAERSGHKEDR